MSGRRETRPLPPPLPNRENPLNPPTLLGGSWVLITPTARLLITDVEDGDSGDLGGLTGAVILGVYRYPEPPSSPKS